MSDLIERAINETIILRIILPPDLPAAMADPHQLENAILNLALNARDAMPHRGTLTVQASVVDLDGPHAAAQLGLAAGRYLMVAVADTGVGMPSEIVDKVLEPFFTTKPLGQGTGLGLSMVYGFACQSGGAVHIHSRVSIGTAVKLFLPVTAAAPVNSTEPAPIVPRGAGEQVLVVEDDPAVRLLVREVLQELNYHAVEYADPMAVLPILASRDRIDLLISDIGLPGMNGRELAENARAQA